MPLANKQYCLYDLCFLFICRKLFEEDEQAIINKVLNSLQISSIDVKKDGEMERLISVLIACDCILKGPFLFTKEQILAVLERLNKILELLPPLNYLNEYPKAVQFRNVVEKIRDDCRDANPTLFIGKMLGEE